jgi:tetratricopeptide (TPR) repeat protein
MNTRTPALALVVAVLFTGCSAAAMTPPASSPNVEPAAPTTRDVPLPGAETRQLIDQATAAVRADATDATALLTLGLGYYQLARETADPTNYARAAEAFDRMLAIDPDDAEALLGKGTVALARHDFAGGLELGERAHQLAPRTARAYGVVGDALTELGRYDEAVEAVQAMVDLRPDLGSYSRVSYQRELHGQLDGAIEAMEQAVEAGGPSTENTEYVRVLLGNLWFLAGDLDKSEASYDASLDRSPGYTYALAGQARVATARGDLDGSIRLLQQATAAVPFPDLLITLGETQQAVGRTDDANATYALVRQIEDLFRANGVNTDLDMALFEADHGDPATALELARAAYRATPNVKAADALGWALYRNGDLAEARTHAEESLRLGSLEPSYRYHAGVIAAAEGDSERARTWLSDSLARNPAWSALNAPRAQAALEALSR